MKRTGGFTPPVKQMVLKRSQEIRKEWSSDSSMPRKLKISYTGKKIHYEPTPIMEFRDSEETIRFFRPKDQLKVASIKTFRALQNKLNREDDDKAWFDGILKKQIEINEENLRTKRRSSRNK